MLPFEGFVSMNASSGVIYSQQGSELRYDLLFLSDSTDPSPVPPHQRTDGLQKASHGPPCLKGVLNKQWS